MQQDLGVEMSVVPLGPPSPNPGAGEQFISPVFDQPPQLYHSSDDEGPVDRLDVAPSHDVSRRAQVERGEEESIEIRDDWSPANVFNPEPNSPAEHFKARVIFVKAVLGELLCTTIFLFVIMCNAVNFGQMSQDDAFSYPNPVVSGLCTAFVAVAVIYSFADVSGANFNPAVTFAALVTRKTTPVKAMFYIGAQLLASIFATFLIWLVFPRFKEPDTQRTAIEYLVLRPGPSANIGELLLLEFLMCFMLVYVIFAVAFDTIQPEVQVLNSGGEDTTRRKKLTIYSTSGKTKAGFAPLAIGFTHGFLAFIGASISGGGFNPARAFGPALLAWDWNSQWAYWFAELSGGALAAYAQLFFSARGKLCCATLQAPPEKEV